MRERWILWRWIGWSCGGGRGCWGGGRVEKALCWWTAPWLWASVVGGDKTARRQ